MADTRRDARPRGQTRDSTLRRPVTVQQSDLIDSLQKSPPKTFTQLSSQFTRFVRFATQIFVRGVTGGQGRFGRWNHHGDFIESTALREKDGFIGIGEDDPQSPLHVTSEDIFNAITLEVFGNTNGLVAIRSEGTKKAPTAIAADSIILVLSARGFDGVNQTQARARVVFLAAELFTASAQGARLEFETTRNGTTTRLERMRISNEGHVEMRGTSSAFRLHNETLTQRDAVPNPANGMLVYNETDHTIDAYINGAWTRAFEARSFYSGVHGGPTTTVITTINVAVRLQGTLTQLGLLQSFTSATVGGGTEITYTGTDRFYPIILALGGSGQKVGGGVPETMAVEIRVNNVIVGVSGDFSTRQTQPDIFQAEAAVRLETNDVVSFFIINKSGVSDMSVNSYAVSINGN